MQQAHTTNTTASFKPAVCLQRETERLITVDFDVTNPEHLEAYRMITSVPSRQHPRYRFRLEHPFVDVRAMMNAKVGAAYLAMMNQSDARLAA